MSLHILVAHSGEHIRADPVAFASLEALRTWIAQRIGVSAANQILMTPRGRQVKLQTLLTEKEMFIFDRLLISPAAAGQQPAASEQAMPPSLNLDDPPDTISSQTDLSAWQRLFRSRRTWAVELLESCSSMAEAVERSAAEVTTMERAIGVAITNLQTHVRGLEQRHGDAHLWAADLLKEQEFTLRDWDAISPDLGKIPVHGEFLRFASSPETSGPSNGSEASGKARFGKEATLKNFIRSEDVRQAASLSRKISRELSKQVEEIGGSVQEIVTSTEKLVVAVDSSLDQTSVEIKEECGRLMEDIEVVTKKVGTDTDHVANITSSSKSISQVSKMALLHTRNYLPSLKQSCLELDSLQRQAIEKRNLSARNAVQHLQTVSVIESMLASVNPLVAKLEVGPEGLAAFDLLNHVSRLPAVYGSLLVESIRRREWAEKIKADSSSLAEELAIYKEEEERRRKKWQKSLGGFINVDKTDGRPLGVELNLLGDEQPWPYVHKADIEEYVKSLGEVAGTEGAVKEILRMAHESDQPTRQQSKRAKAFKSGSIYDASFGRHSLLLMRGNDDMVRSLKDEKSALEDRLKGSESRIRKLEDLLHRQSHINRPSGNNGFQIGSTYGSESPIIPQSSTPVNPPSPRPQGANSRRSSFSTRRFSATQNPEERTLVQRIVSLEADLIAERENASGLQKEVSMRKETAKELQDRNDEAESMKKDLMENLDSQKRGFSAERRLLEGEIEKVHLRLEEVEDELERVLGSRDQGKAGMDLRVQHLEGQLQKTREDAEKNAERLRDNAESLRTTVKELRERAEARERQSQTEVQERKLLEEKIRDLEARLAESDAARTTHQRGLSAVHARLAPDKTTPTATAALIEAIDAAAGSSLEKLREQSDLLGVARSDLKAGRKKFEKTETEKEALQAKLREEENHMGSLRTTLAAGHEQVTSLREELEHAKLVVTNLEADLSMARKGSDDLEKRVGDDKVNSAAIRADLARAINQVHALTEELSLKTEALRKEEASSQTARSQLSSRTQKAQDLSDRAYVQKEKLHRLLELLGFVVTFREGSMMVDRVPKSTGASVTDADPQMALARSTSGPVPTRKENPEERALAAWMHDTEGEEGEDARYAAFMEHLGKFDLDTFTEVIVKRVKETEHLTRRWQKEARGYRDKAHRFQIEAHEKIAFRSFKDGDLALFLPTRNQATRPWAAFNVGAPHYFLREQDSHKLRARDWLLARISKVEERMVDLSKSINGVNQPPSGDRRSIGELSDGGKSFDDENPFELSDGLRWYLLDAAEEKPGAPSTPGLGKSTVASAHVDVKGSIRLKKPRDANEATRTLSKSLDSRRGSSNSRKGVPASPALVAATSTGTIAGARPPSAESHNTVVGGGSNLRDATTPGSGPTSAPGLGISSPARDAGAQGPSATQTQEHPSAVTPTPTPTKKTATAKPVPTPAQRPSSNLWDSLFSVDFSVGSVKGNK